MNIHFDFCLQTEPVHSSLLFRNTIIKPLEFTLCVNLKTISNKTVWQCKLLWKKCQSIKIFQKNRVAVVLYFIILWCLQWNSHFKVHLLLSNFTNCFICINILNSMPMVIIVKLMLQNIRWKCAFEGISRLLHFHHHNQRTIALNIL